MSDLELQGELKAEVDSAINYADFHLAAHRTKAIKYYRGDPFGTEEPGRSAVVMTTLRDSVQQALPSLMRVFCGSERVVEFVGREPEDQPAAEQATDYINYVLMNDNQGYQVIRGVFKDALYQKVGIVKAFYDSSMTVSYHSFTGLTLIALNELLNDGNVEFLEVEETENGTFDCEIRRMKPREEICVENLPPEEFLISRDARSLENAQFTAHRSMKTVSDLVAMGYPKDLVERHKTKNDDLTWNRERFARNRFELTDSDLDAERVLYIECYTYKDVDGDGIAELRRVCLMGDGYEIVANEPWDRIPFADFHVDPDAHTFIGYDLADRTMDLQETNSELMRSVLDSLAQTVNPRVGVVDGKVNMEDVLNNENGGIIRMDAPGMVQPFAQPFVGKEAMPVLGLFDEVKEQRTGISRQAAGLDADALQSMTASAVSAIEQGSKLTLEEMARCLATGFKKLMKLLLHLTTKHQDAARVVRLRNEWVEINPATWDANMDVSINVGLGNGGEERKMALLSQTLEMQQAVLQQMGISNPLVGLGQVRYTWAKMLEIGGFTDPSRFVKPLPLDFEVPPPPDEPTPEELYYMAEREATMAKMQTDAQRLQLDAQEVALKDDRERDRDAVNAAIKIAELNKSWAEMEKSIEEAREKMKAGANG